MKCVVEQHEGFTIVRIEGRIDIGDGDIKLRHGVREAALFDCPGIILDFTKVTYMDSSGIGELVSIYSELQKSGKNMCLAHLNAKIYDLMTLTQLIAVLPVFDSVEDAMMTMIKAA
ncbi:Anti-sigma factor antagonist [Sulfidibacter corallicola]|uniref:Anti-sigma factor antagonist n=1 Tax=Sulfidibacter corallicola TaxID=2818388 RepID=A0A8A4TYE8_SULCO|nr:STAS domain-containing protein [Sulfidibacter corallicola]QTD54357.1 STAS domain-containing protein [Sulfidibacter corallicola]